MYYKQWKKTALSLCLAAFFMLQMFPAHGYAIVANGEPSQTAPEVSPAGGEASREAEHMAGL